MHDMISEYIFTLYISTLYALPLYLRDILLMSSNEKMKEIYV